MHVDAERRARKWLAQADLRPTKQRVALAESACNGKKNPSDVADCKVDVIATGEASMADLCD